MSHHGDLSRSTDQMGRTKTHTLASYLLRGWNMFQMDLGKTRIPKYNRLPWKPRWKGASLTHMAEAAAVQKWDSTNSLERNSKQRAAKSG
ncbi:hypothetical protein AOLI_G00145760 [Acnodon oligacanthus]